MRNYLKILVVLLGVLVALPAVGGTITRAIKDGSGTGDYADGTTILTSEVNADFNLIVDAINGDLENVNIKALAGIVYEKLNLTGKIVVGDLVVGFELPAANVDDYSVSAVEQATSSDPGTSDAAAPTLATNIEEELAQLRYKIEQLVVGTSATHTTSGTGSSADASWIDGPLRPGNMIYHGGFDAWQQDDCLADACVAEAPWDMVTTKQELADTALTESEGAGGGMGMQITGNGAALAGISQTIDGLRASTRYLAVASVRPTTGDSCRMVTTGADTTQMSVDSASDNAFEVISGIFTTDATPANVVLQLLAVADGDICLFDHVGVYEINTDPAPRAGRVVAKDSIAIETTMPDGSGSISPAATGLAVTVTPPNSSCIVETHAVVNYATDGTGDFDVLCQISENTTMKSLSVNGHDQWDGDNLKEAFGAIDLSYTNANPAPGAALAYTVECSYNNGLVQNGDTNYYCANATCALTVDMDCRD